MRQLLGSWGAELTDEQLALALLGLGVIPQRARQRGGRQALAALARQLSRQPEDILQWRLGESPAAESSWAHAIPRASLVAAVATGLTQAQGPCRIAIGAGGVFDALTLWHFWSGALATFFSSLKQPPAMHFRKAAKADDVRFRWPIEVGYLPDSNGEYFGQALRDMDSWARNVFDVVPLSRRRISCDLLVLPTTSSVGDLVQALSSAAVQLGGISADVVIVSLDMSFEYRVLEELEPLRRLVRATGLIVLPPPVLEPIQTTIRQMLVEISHNAPLDVAAATATQSRALFVADARLIGQAQLIVRAKASGAALASGQYRDAVVELDGVAAQRIGLDKDTVSLEDVGNALTRNADDYDWLFESDEASALGHVLRRAREEKETTSRFLQAAILAQGLRSTEPIQSIETALQAHTPYKVAVRIGAAIEGFLRGSQAFPDELLQDDGRSHELTIAFWDQSTGRKARTEGLLLPAVGDSNTCEFEIETGGGDQAYVARITVLHRNRVLQSGLLTAPVGVSEGGPKFILDVTARTRLGDLDERLNFDLAFVLNDVHSQGLIHTVRGDHAAVLKIDDTDVRALQDVCNIAITKITEEPERYQGLYAPGTEELLRVLAQKGAKLRQYISKYALRGDSLVSPRYVQVVAAKPGKVLPVEFIYELEAPDDTATLCPNAVAALSADLPSWGASANGMSTVNLMLGVPSGMDACPGCPMGTSPDFDAAETICPLAFWGTRCVIERGLPHYMDRGDFEVSAEPGSAEARVLYPLDAALVGATKKANLVDPLAVNNMINRLKQLASSVNEVASWADWVNATKAKPSMLVLLLHQEQGEYGPVLDIGSQPYLKTDLIKKKHVRPDASMPAPLALLVGCETAYSEISYESASQGFLDAGAAAVISTVAKVLGRDAAPVVAELVEEMSNTKVPMPLGQILMKVRRKMLVGGTPMVLSLIAVGDADWEVAARV